MGSKKEETMLPLRKKEKYVNDSHCNSELGEGQLTKLRQ